MGTKGDAQSAAKPGEPDSSEGSSGGGGRAMRVLVGGLIVLMLVIAGVVWFAYRDVTAGERVGLGEVYGWAEAGEVVSATLLDADAVLVGQRCTAGGADTADAGGGCRETVAFHADYPESDAATQALIDRLAAGGAAVDTDPQVAKQVATFAAMFILPLVLLANLFGIVFVWRSGGGGDESLAQLAGFSRMRSASKQGSAGPGVSFADVAGADEALAELREVSEYLADPKRFAGYGAAVPKGVLLLGPPGCGKTLLAKAVAGESKVPFFSVAGTEFVESLVGVGAARVRDLFAHVRAAAPAIVFIDEIDAVGRARGGEAGMSGGEREQTLNQLLVELDGFDPATGIVVIGATNRADILDQALQRPGRFDRHVTVSPPDVAGREAVLALHARDRPVAADVDFAAIARQTSGFTGADLANVVNEAALMAIRADMRQQIGQAEFSEAVVRVLHGPRRFGHLLADDERRRLAAHEAGHAIVAAALAGATIDRLSILPRGQGLGHASASGEGDRMVSTAGELAGELAAALAGLAAEQLVFADTATTGDADLERANRLARQIVGRYGMSAGLGRLRVVRPAGGHLDQRDGVELVSGQTMAAFDGEVAGLLAAAEQAAGDVLADHRAAFDALAGALHQAETLEGATLDRYLQPVRGHPDHPFLATLDGHQPATSQSTSARSSSGASKATSKTASKTAKTAGSTGRATKNRP